MGCRVHLLGELVAGRRVQRVGQVAIAAVGIVEVALIGDQFVVEAEDQLRGDHLADAHPVVVAVDISLEVGIAVLVHVVLALGVTETQGGQIAEKILADVEVPGV